MKGNWLIKVLMAFAIIGLALALAGSPMMCSKAMGAERQKEYLYKATTAVGGFAATYKGNYVMFVESGIILSPVEISFPFAPTFGPEQFKHGMVFIPYHNLRDLVKIWRYK